MRLNIRIDGIIHMIDTIDPELMFRWVKEIFARMPDWNAATQVELTAMPSYLPDGYGGWATDWHTDSRLIGQPQKVRKPAQWIEALQKLAEAEIDEKSQEDK